MEVSLEYRGNVIQCSFIHALCAFLSISYAFFFPYCYCWNSENHNANYQENERDSTLPGTEMRFLQNEHLETIEASNFATNNAYSSHLNQPNKNDSHTPALSHFPPSMNDSQNITPPFTLSRSETHEFAPKRKRTRLSSNENATSTRYSANNEQNPINPPPMNSYNQHPASTFEQASQNTYASQLSSGSGTHTESENNQSESLSYSFSTIPPFNSEIPEFSSTLTSVSNNNPPFNGQNKAMPECVSPLSMFFAEHEQADPFLTISPTLPIDERVQSIEEILNTAFYTTDPNEISLQEYLPSPSCQFNHQQMNVHREMANQIGHSQDQMSSCPQKSAPLESQSHQFYQDVSLNRNNKMVARQRPFNQNIVNLPCQGFAEPQSAANAVPGANCATQPSNTWERANLNGPISGSQKGMVNLTNNCSARAIMKTDQSGDSDALLLAYLKKKLAEFLLTYPNVEENASVVNKITHQLLLLRESTDSAGNAGGAWNAVNRDRSGKVFSKDNLDILLKSQISLFIRKVKALIWLKDSKIPTPMFSLSFYNSADDIIAALFLISEEYLSSEDLNLILSWSATQTLVRACEIALECEMYNKFLKRLHLVSGYENINIIEAARNLKAVWRWKQLRPIDERVLAELKAAGTNGNARWCCWLFCRSIKGENISTIFDIAPEYLLSDDLEKNTSNGACQESSNLTVQEETPINNDKHADLIESSAFHRFEEDSDPFFLPFLDHISSATWLHIITALLLEYNMTFAARFHTFYEFKTEEQLKYNVECINSYSSFDKYLQLGLNRQEEDMKILFIKDATRLSKFIGLHTPVKHVPFIISHLITYATPSINNSPGLFLYQNYQDTLFNRYNFILKTIVQLIPRLTKQNLTALFKLKECVQHMLLQRLCNFLSTVTLQRLSSSTAAFLVTTLQEIQGNLSSANARKENSNLPVVSPSSLPEGIVPATYHFLVLCAYKESPQFLTYIYPRANKLLAYQLSPAVEAALESPSTPLATCLTYLRILAHPLNGKALSWAAFYKAVTCRKTNTLESYDIFQITNSLRIFSLLLKNPNVLQWLSTPFASQVPLIKGVDSVSLETPTAAANTASSSKTTAASTDSVIPPPVFSENQGDTSILYLLSSYESLFQLWCSQMLLIAAEMYFAQNNHNVNPICWVSPSLSLEQRMVVMARLARTPLLADIIKANKSPHLKSIVQKCAAYIRSDNIVTIEGVARICLDNTRSARSKLRAYRQNKPAEQSEAAQAVDCSLTDGNAPGAEIDGFTRTVLTADLGKKLLEKWLPDSLELYAAYVTFVELRPLSF